MSVETPDAREWERLRPELQLHCYRMLGSVHDAEDLVQETLLAAWRAEPPENPRAWLYKIATNRCLNAIRDAKRRPPLAPEPPFAAPEPSALNDVTWLEPGREETISLAFIAAFQRLPPRQTAAVVLVDVLGFSTAEAAAMLDARPTAIKGLLQRARTALGPPPDPPHPDEQALAERFARAFAADDIDGVVALLTDDAWLAMPPAPHVYDGREAIGAFLRASAAHRGRRFELTPVRLNDQPAFELSYGGRIVLTTRADGICGLTRFLEP
jgi:RNA polymerase sigma-70 factor (ECF subfamily)